MHAQRAQWTPAACDTWEAKVIPPRGALKANLRHCVKVIFYLTENMVQKELPCLSWGTSEPWFIRFSSSIQMKMPSCLPAYYLTGTGKLDWSSYTACVHARVHLYLSLNLFVKLTWNFDLPVWPTISVTMDFCGPVKLILIKIIKKKNKPQT